ncbi:MAG: hypothetical protein RR903_07610, partial [Edwardsiella sp. (in: enterobacteria)]
DHKQRQAYQRAIGEQAIQAQVGQQARYQHRQHQCDERQRQQAGMYGRSQPSLSEEEQQRLLWEGGYPVLASVARRKGLARPHIGDDGQIDAPQAWWDAMQAARS